MVFSLVLAGWCMQESLQLAPLLLLLGGHGKGQAPAGDNMIPQPWVSLGPAGDRLWGDWDHIQGRASASRSVATGYRVPCALARGQDSQGTRRVRSGGSGDLLLVPGHQGCWLCKRRGHSRCPLRAGWESGRGP